MTESLRDRRVRYAQAILQSHQTSAALLGETSDLDGLRVLVLGTASAETLCALMHTECRKAEMRLPEGHVDAQSADLVLVPHVSLRTMPLIVAQAARALDTNGRVVIAAPSGERGFVDAAMRALLLAGFWIPHLQSAGNRTLIHASAGGAVSRA